MKVKVSLSVLLIVFTLAVHGQKKTLITGRVTYTDSKPVAGASVFVDNLNTGRITTKDGFYKIRVGQKAGTISILTESGKLSEIKINRTGSNNIVIHEETKNITIRPEDELINIGYGSANERNLTETVGRIDAENSNIHFTSIYEMLGTQPGIIVRGKNIFIRGINSVNDSQPLFVVEGIVVSDIDDIHPESVKSINILKGPSAAIYGSRGANGVIMISLKK